MLWPRKRQMNALKLPVRILLGESLTALPGQQSFAVASVASQIGFVPEKLLEESYGYLGETGLGTRTKSLV